MNYRFASSGNSGLKTWSRAWYVQKSPYRDPMPFQFHSRNETRYPFSLVNDQVNDYAYMRTEPTNRDHTRLGTVTTNARNRAVSMIKEGRGAALGLTLLDWRSSHNLLTNAFKALASKADRKQLYYKRRSSSLFLEGIFGWVPLMQDIHDAFETLSEAHRSSPVRAKNSIVYSENVNDANNRLAVQTELGAMVGAQGRMYNPNLALLSDLGLINPAAVLWDKVPYSFVVNWFIPIGGYLNSLTDLVGYTTERAYVTTFVRKTAAGTIRVTDPDTGKLVWRDRSVQTLYVNRTLGFPAPTLPQFQLPTADLYKSLVSFALLNENLQKPMRNLRRGWRGRHRYSE